MTKSIAAKLYKMRKTYKDDNVWLLSSLILLKDNSDLTNVLDFYNKIHSGEITVVETTSSIELLEEQKKKIETKIKEKFPDSNLVFIFDIDKKVTHGLQILIGDDLVEL